MTDCTAVCGHRQLLENLGFQDALPPEPMAEPSALSSVDAAAQSLEDAHLHNASLGGDGFGGDGLSPHGEENGDFFEQQGTEQSHLHAIGNAACLSHNSSERCDLTCRSCSILKCLLYLLAVVHVSLICLVFPFDIFHGFVFSAAHYGTNLVSS